MYYLLCYRMHEEAVESVERAATVPNDKHVHVLLRLSALCRKMGGIIGILCKSGTFVYK